MSTGQNDAPTKWHATTSGRRLYLLIVLCSGCNAISLFGGSSGQPPADGGASSIGRASDALMGADSPVTNDGLNTGNVADRNSDGGLLDSRPTGTPDSTGAPSGTLDAGTAVPIPDGAQPGFPGFLPDGGPGSSAIPADSGLLSTVAGVDGAVIVPPIVSTAIPSPQASSAVPAPNPEGGTLALAGNGIVDAGAPGCGEPSTCFLRASIITERGNAYGAILSTGYPTDTCARNIVDDKATVWIADSNRRPTTSLACGNSAPQISVGFFVPSVVATVGRLGNHFWASDDGFNSQWRLINGLANDSGEYAPIVGATSRLEFWWYSPVSGGEAYGQVQVPLRHTATGMQAVGYLLFDVRIR